MSQIALPWPRGSRGGPDRIVVGEGNRAVVEALGAPQHWPFRTAVLTGPPRSGKSLLARWFARNSVNEALDNAHEQAETEVFHLWNRAQEDRRPLLIVAGEPPWDISLPDLKSRLGAALQLEIAPPDDAMMGELLLSLAAERGLPLGPDAPAYLVPRASRSYVTIERLVETIDRLSLERKVPPTLAVWRAALEAVEGPEEPRLF